MPLHNRRSLRTSIYDTEPEVLAYREYDWNRDLRRGSRGRRRRRQHQGSSSSSSQAAPPPVLQCTLSSGMYAVPGAPDALDGIATGSDGSDHGEGAVAAPGRGGATDAARLLLASRHRLARQRAIQEEITHATETHLQAQGRQHENHVRELQRRRQQHLLPAAPPPQHQPDQLHLPQQHQHPRSTVRARSHRGNATRPNSVDDNVARLQQRLSVYEEDEQGDRRSNAVRVVISGCSTSSSLGGRGGAGASSSAGGSPREPIAGSPTAGGSVGASGGAGTDDTVTAAATAATSMPSKVSDLLRAGLARIEQQTRAQEDGVQTVASQAEEIMAKSPRLRERLSRQEPGRTPTTPSAADTAAATTTTTTTPAAAAGATARPGDVVIDLADQPAAAHVAGRSTQLQELLRTRKIRIVETDVVFTDDDGGHNEGGDRNNNSDDAGRSGRARARAQELAVVDASAADLSGSDSMQLVTGGFTLRIKGASSTARSTPAADGGAASGRGGEASRGNEAGSAGSSNHKDDDRRRTNQILFAAASAARVAAEAAAAAAYVSIGTGGFTEEAYQKVLQLLALP